MNDMPTKICPTCSLDMTPLEQQQLLDQFACAALHGMVSNGVAQKLLNGGLDFMDIKAEIARQAYGYASVMLAERARRMKK